MQLNQEQSYIVDQAVKFYKYSSEQVFQFEGPPGTGKSVVEYAIADRLVREGLVHPSEILAAAYTGQAAIVMRTKGFPNAKTLHSWFYDPKDKPMTDEMGRVIMNTRYNTPVMDTEFTPKHIVGKKAIFIDEGYLTAMSMKHDIEKHGIKIFVGGDTRQLPPVNDDPAYLVSGKIYHLTQIMRQSENSGILYIANRAIAGLPIHKGIYGNTLVIEWDDITDEMLSNSSVIICGKNKTREYINDRIRRDILNIKMDIPVYGERLICRKNNWKTELDGISLANGLVGTCTTPPNISSFNGKTFTMNFMPDLINGAFEDLVCDYNYYIAPYDKKAAIKEDKYSIGEKFDLAYALTTYLAQGAEYSCGIYISEHMYDDSSFDMLNYTGSTRFRNGLIYVLPRKRRYYNGIH